MSRIVMPKPDWLKIKIPGGQNYSELVQELRGQKLHTVCEEAKCPNIGECWSNGVATVMILGDVCTRACGFCNVKTGRPDYYDLDEPRRMGEMLQGRKLKYLTITSVNRDELPDQGAQVWAETILAVRRALPGVKIEILTPDFRGDTILLDSVLASSPDVYNHNLETVYRLQKSVRKMANWEHSTAVLRHAKKSGFVTKTGLMVGLGETDQEVLDYISQMAEIGVDILSLGQYLQPTRKHLDVHRYVHPDQFAQYKVHAYGCGIRNCESGPLVRSSYHADEQSQNLWSQNDSPAPLSPKALKN